MKLKFKSKIGRDEACAPSRLRLLLPWVFVKVGGWRPSYSTVIFTTCHRCTMSRRAAPPQLSGAPWGFISSPPQYFHPFFGYRRPKQAHTLSLVQTEGSNNKREAA